MRHQVITVRNHGRALNYGSDRVRFPAAVPVGSRLRLYVRVAAAETHRDGVMLRIANTMEIDGLDRPAMVADTLTLVIR